MHETAGLLFETVDGRSRFLVEAGAPPFVVGRRPPYEPHNVKLRTILASREHVRITPPATAGGVVIVEDAASTGGAYLDDERLTGPTAIGPGARLRLTGDAVFTVRPFRGDSFYRLVTRATGALCDALAAGALVRDVLGALAPLHATGEPHGNLDWHHLLRDDSGAWITLIDGWTVLDPTGTLACNPSYCAPEVFTRSALVPASDVYTVGLLAFEARFGRRPFERDTIHEHMLAKATGAAPAWPPRERLTDGERDLYERLLALDPADRPTVARALVDKTRSP